MWKGSNYCPTAWLSSSQDHLFSVLFLIVTVIVVVGLDVVRTDQPLMFYQTETNQAKLWNILSIYAWVDSDISYVQGMYSDFQSLFLIPRSPRCNCFIFDHSL